MGRQGPRGAGRRGHRARAAAPSAAGSWQLVGEFTEVESGNNAARAELAKALALCKRERAKLVIAKHDRLSRNVAFLATRVDFVACDNPRANNKLTIHIHHSRPRRRGASTSAGSALRRARCGDRGGTGGGGGTPGGGTLFGLTPLGWLLPVYRRLQRPSRSRSRARRAVNINSAATD